MKRKLMIYFFGNFGTKLLSFVMVPLYTSYVSPEDFGVFDFWITIVNFFIILISLQLYDATYTNILKIKNYNKQIHEVKKRVKIEINTIFSVLTVQIALTLILAVISYMLSYKIMCFSFIIIILNIVFSTLSQGIARGFEENKLMATSGFFMSLVTLVVTLYLVKYDKYLLFDKLDSLFIGQITGLVTANVFLFFVLVKKGIINRSTFKLSEKNIFKLHLKTLLSFSLPMIPNALSWWIMNVSDRFIIIEFLSSAHNGIYAMANKLPSLIFMVNTIYNLAWQDEAIKNANSAEAHNIYSKQLFIYVYMQFGFLILFTLFLPIFAPYILKNEFSDSIKYVPLLTLAAVFSGISSFYGTFYFSTGKTKGAFYTSMWGAIVNIIFNLVLIKYIGLYAPVISTIISFLLMFLLRSFEFKKRLRIKIPVFSLVTLTSVFFFLYFIIY
ncbi:lipopolysaccharide biosynthesis protein [Priestia megaterium]